MEILLTILWDHIIPLPKDPSFSPTTFPKLGDCFANWNKLIGDSVIMSTVLLQLSPSSSTLSSSLESSQSFTCWLHACHVCSEKTGWGIVPWKQRSGVTILALAAWRFLELLLPTSFPGLLYSRVAWWVVEWFSRGSVPRFGHLRQWERDRKRLFFSLLAGNGLCLLFLEPQG